MTAFTKFTASVALPLPARSVSQHRLSPAPTAARAAPDSAVPAFITRHLRPVRLRRRTTATVPGTAMTTLGSGLRSPPVLSFTA